MNAVRFQASPRLAFLFLLIAILVRLAILRATEIYVLIRAKREERRNKNERNAPSESEGNENLINKKCEVSNPMLSPHVSRFSLSFSALASRKHLAPADSSEASSFRCGKFARCRHCYWVNRRCESLTRENNQKSIGIRATNRIQVGEAPRNISAPRTLCSRSAAIAKRETAAGGDSIYCRRISAVETERHMCHEAVDAVTNK